MKDKRFTDTILRWYAENRRDLPWRRTRDPYAVWLCEIIMQQTRIAQGTAYWERFMEAFPTVGALAKASEDEVLRLWQGLGYYSRARNLHAAARQVVALGGFPKDYDGIRALKGIGDYTAAAIGSIAFGLPVAAVDGNVYRVLARHYGIDGIVGTTAAKKEFTALAQALLPEDRPGDFNQAMMDFGALQCTPVSPACLTCPLMETCHAFSTGRVELLPVKKAPAAILTRHLTYVYLRCKGETALRRRGPGDIWQGLWEPLLFEESAPQTPKGVRSSDTPPIGSGYDRWKKRFEEAVHSGQAILLADNVKHQLTHRTLLADFYLWTLDTDAKNAPDEKPQLPQGYVWIPEADLDRCGKSRLFEILLSRLP